MLKAQDAASAVLTKFKNLLHETGDEAEGSKAKLAAIGVAGLVVAGVAAKVGEDSLKAYSTFQSAAASMQGQADITNKAANDMSNAFMSGFQGMEYSSTQAMQAFAPVAGTFETMSGHALSAAAAVKAMKVSMELADATGETLQQTTSDMSTYLLDMGGKAGDAGKDMNLLFNTSRLTGMGIDQLTTMIGRMKPTLTGSGVGVQQLAGVMVMLAKHFGQGRKTISLAGQVIQHLVTPSSDAMQVMQLLGIKTETARGKFVGLTQALRNIKVGMDQQWSSSTRAQAQLLAFGTTTTDWTSQEKNMSDAQLKSVLMQKMFSGTLAANIGVLMNNTGQLNKYAGAAGKAGGLQRAAAEQAATLHGKMEILHSSVHDMTTAIGAGLAPVMEKLAHLVVPLITKMSEWAAKHKTLSAIILASVFGLGLLAAAIAAVTLATVAFEAVSWPLIALIGGIVLVVAALAFGVYELVKHWSTVSGFFRRVWGDIKNAFEVGYHDVLGALRRFADEVKHLFSDAGHWLINAGKQLLEGLWRGIDSMVGTVVNHVKDIGHKIIGAAKSILGVFSPSTVFHDIGANLMLGMANGIADHANVATSKIRQMAASIQLVMRQNNDLARQRTIEMEAWLRTAWELIRSQAVTYWQQIKNELIALWTDITNAANSAFEGFIGLFTGIWQTVENDAIAAWDWLKGFPAELWGWFEDGFHSAWAAISGLADDTWTWFWGEAQKAWKAVSTLADDAWDWFSKEFTKAWKALSGLADDTWTWFWGEAQKAWKAVSTLADDAWDWFSKEFTKAWKALSGLADDTWTWFWGEAQKAWKAVSTLADDAWDWFSKEFTKAWKAVGSFARTYGGDAITGLWDGMKAVWQKVEAWFDDFDGMIGQYFKDASSWLESIGEDIINGLWNGLKSKFEDVKSWLSGVGSTIASLKGPPAKDQVLLTPAGQAIIQGLQEGMQAKMPTLLTMVGGIAPQISQTVTQTATPAAMPMAGGGTAGGTVINMTVTGNTIMNQNDINQLTSRISNHLARYIIPSSGMRPVAP